MRRRSLFRLAAVPLMMFVLTGCADEIDEIFDFVPYLESDDPQTRQLGETLKEIKEEREAQAAVDRFLETGDRRHLDEALSIRPDDTSLLGYDVVLATLGGDAAAIETAQQALAGAEARRLQSLTGPGDEPTTAAQIRRNVLGEILVAQTKMLGGSLNSPWDPPGADASPDMRLLYQDYCDTRHEIQTQFNDSLSYIPLPPCPAN